MSIDTLTQYQKEQLVKQYGNLLNNPLKFALKIQNVAGTETTSPTQTTSAGVVAYLASRFDDLSEFMQKSGGSALDLEEIVHYAIKLDQESPDDDQQHISALMLGLSPEHKQKANQILAESHCVTSPQ